MLKKSIFIVAVFAFSVSAQTLKPLEIIRPNTGVFYYGDTMIIEYTGYTLLTQEIGKSFSMSFDSGKTFSFSLFSTRDSYYDTAVTNEYLSASTISLAGVDTTTPKYCCIIGRCYKEPGQYYSPDTSDVFMVQSRYTTTKTFTPIIKQGRLFIPSSSPTSFTLSGRRMLPVSSAPSVFIRRDRTRGFVELH